MAQPTVTSISPSVGHTGGRVLVEIIGSGFALPPPPPPTGVVPDVLPTVSVTFGGVPALDVAVHDATLLYAVAPPSPAFTMVKGVPDWGPGVVDVVVQNLDLAGNPVAGESVTLPAAFEYRRPDLSRESHATTVMGRFIEELRRQVVPIVDYAVHTDWSDGGRTVDLGQIAQMPAVVIVDLEFANSAAHPQGPQEVDLQDGHFAVRREPEAVDAVMSLLGVAESVVEVQNLMVGLRLFFKKNPALRVPRSNAALPPGSTAYDTSGPMLSYTLEYDVTEPIKTTAGGNNSNLKTFMVACVIRGILIEDWPGVVEEGTSDTPATLAHEATTGITVVADRVDLGVQPKG